MESSIRIIEEPISIPELKIIAEERFGDMVKAVVDLENKIMAIGGELHADEEAALLERDSKQENLWGINLYPDKPLAEIIEYDSMINLRPRQGNRTRGVEDAEIRQRIKDLVDLLVKL